MPFPALLDTCSIWGAYLCDTLLSIAAAGAYRPLWSAAILDELHRGLVECGIDDDAVKRRISDMRRAFPGADVAGYESLIDSMTCDPKDRHVLAAAVRGGAEVLVTFNLKDFPLAATDPFDVTVVHPDDFLLGQLDLYPGLVIVALQAQADRYTRPPTSVPELLARLAAAGVPRFAAEASRHLMP